MHDARQGSLSLGTALLLLWLAGVSLRITVLAIPPVLPAIHSGLHIDETLIGALTGLPTLLLSLGAVGGSFLVARLGGRRALLVGLGLVAAAGAARGLGPSAAILFLMTGIMGLGIAISQPVMPALVRDWSPGHIALATSVYSNGTLMGEIIATGLMRPVVLPLVRQSWEIGLAVWSLPVILTVLGVLVFSNHHPVQIAAGLPVRWWPNWTNPLTWRLGLILGCASAAYFGSNAFLPDYLRATHHGSLITATLIAINLAQLPASPLAWLLASRLIARRLPLAVAGAVILISGLGLAFGGFWTVIFGASLGFACGLVLVLALALPPLFASAGDVHRLSAGIFSISYACPFFGPLIGGAIWDISGVPASGFLPIVVAGSCLLLLVFGLRFPARYAAAV